MQNAGFQALGLDWTYELLDVPAAELPAAAARLRDADVGGANVTIPHKQAVMDHLDTVDADALRARAVNTIAKEGTRLVGSNTDVDGIRAAIAEVGLEPRGANAPLPICERTRPNGRRPSLFQQASCWLQATATARFCSPISPRTHGVTPP